MSVDSATVILVSWLATYAIHSSIVLGAAWLVTRHLPPRLDSVAEAVWRAALVASMLSPALRTVLPSSSPATFALSGGLSDSISAVNAAGMRISWPLLITTVWVGGVLLGVTTLLSARRQL